MGLDARRGSIEVGEELGPRSIPGSEQAEDGRGRHHCARLADAPHDRAQVGRLDDDADEPDDADDVRDAVAGLGLDELHVHRLGLRPPLGTAADDDLVAALSELVGFDPEPGVQCLAPVPLPGDPARAAIERAVWQIAQVYTLPVQRYRCLELSVVDD